MPSSWFPYALGLGLGWACLCTYHELRKETKGLEEKLQPQLDILFGDQYPYVESISYRQEDGSRTTGKIYRVGVTNRGKETVGRVGVELERTEPPVPVPSHVALHIMHDNPEIEGGLYRREFPLDPGRPVYIDLVQKDSKSGDILICHTIYGISRAIPAGQYAFTVLVYGHNSAPSRREFSIEVQEDGNLVVSGPEKANMPTKG